MKYLCWFLLGDPRATGPGQQSVQNSGMFTSHKVLASFCIYLLIKYHHVNVSQGRIVRIFFFLPFFHPFQPRPLGVAVVQTMSLRQAAGKNTAVFEHSNEF